MSRIFALFPSAKSSMSRNKRLATFGAVIIGAGLFVGATQMSSASAAGGPNGCKGGQASYKAFSGATRSCAGTQNGKAGAVIKAASSKSTDKKAASSKSTDKKAASSKSTDKKAASSKSTDKKAASSKSTDKKAASSKSTGKKAASSKSTGKKAASSKSTEVGPSRANQAATGASSQRDVSCGPGSKPTNFTKNGEVTKGCQLFGLFPSAPLN